MTLAFAPTVDANFNISGGTKFVKYFGTLGIITRIAILLDIKMVIRIPVIITTGLTIEPIWILT